MAVSKFYALMRLPRSTVCRGLIGVGVLGLLGLASLVAPAGAQAQPTTSQKGSQSAPSQLAPGLEILDGSITGNGPESGRTLDSSQATAFLQAWLPDSIYGTAAFQNPPKALPVYQVDVDYKYLGTLGTMTVDYASDGTSAWVSMPPQSLWPGALVTQQRWILAPGRTVAGFEGRLTPAPVPKVAPNHEAIAATSHGSSSHGSSSTTWLLIIAALLVLVAGIGLFVIRRRGAGGSRTQTT